MAPASDERETAAEPQEVLSEEEAQARQQEAKRGGSGDEGARFNLEVASENVSEVMDKLRTNVQYWLDRGRYNKIRIKRGGRPILPDIPVGALMALEAATFFWTGLLRGVIVNVVGRVFFEVELVSDAEEHYRKGLEHFLAGDLDDAEKALEKALNIDPRYAQAHLQMGVLRKMQGKRSEAEEFFESAIAHDDRNKVRREAEAHLRRLRASKEGTVSRIR